MAGRLISAPVGLGVTSIEPLSGPRAVGAGATQSIGNFVQTFSSPFGLWRFRFSFRAMRDADFRRYRGWITALHGGANATRWSFFDPDMMSPADSGIMVPADIRWDNLPGEEWSNGQSWSNGEPWDVTPPLVSIAASAALGASEIRLTNAFWGRKLQVGDYLGFQPFHLGLYMITDVLDGGRYRVWPQLRKALTADDFATLLPTLAMRLESEDAASVGRGLVVADGLSVTLVETLDYDVRDYFTA